MPRRRTAKKILRATKPDGVLAKEYGVSRTTILRARQAAGIEPYSATPTPIDWDEVFGIRQLHVYR